MERLAFRIHYSYVLALVCAILFANALIFMMCTVAMVLHELAHYFVARHRYYRCHKIEISAFGAVLYGDFDNAEGADQIIIALAGPMANIATCVLCYALWWAFPAVYNYTDSLVSASLTMAFVNLLPAYPLDGGRVLVGIMQLQGKDNGLAIAKNMTIVLSVGVFIIFAVGLIVGLQLYNVALFALFLYSSSMSEGDGRCYTRLSLDSNISSRLGVGVEKKILVFDKAVPWGRVILRLRGHYMYEVHVVDSSMKVLSVIPYTTLCSMLASCSVATPIGSVADIVT